MKRNLLSGAALALLAAALIGTPAAAQTNGNSDSKPIRRVGTDAWPVAKDDTKKPATTSSVTTDPLSIKSSAEAKAEKDDAKTQPTSGQSAKDSAVPGASDAAKTPAPASAASSDKPAAAQTATPAASTTATNTSNASIRLGTDAEGRVAINAEQSRKVGAALRKDNARPIEGVDITIKAGVVVPSAVRMTKVSSGLVEIFPQFRDYSYFTTREEIVIIEPASRKIVALVPLKETATASRPSGKTQAATVRTSPEKKHAVRERAVTTGVAIEDRGDLPPPGMVVRETTVTTGAGTRVYRQLEPAGDTVVIRRRAPRQMIELDTD